MLVIVEWGSYARLYKGAQHCLGQYCFGERNVNGLKSQVYALYGLLDYGAHCFVTNLAIIYL